MVVVRRLTLVACGLVWAAALTGCVKNETTTTPSPVAAPSPAPTPAPAPAAPTFSVSGTIFETPPTASTRVADAEVQLTGGVATGSVNDGTFTIPNVATGTYSLRVAKAGYETLTQSVTVSGGNVSGLQLNLNPLLVFIDKEYTAILKPGDPSCNGTSRPCHSYGFTTRTRQDVRAFIAWNSDTADFDLEFWCDEQLVEKRTIVGNTYDEILPKSEPGKRCEIHVLHSGAEMRYTLYLRYAN